MANPRTPRARTDGPPDARSFIRTHRADVRKCETGVWLSAPANAKCSRWLAEAHDEAEKTGNRIVATRVFEIIHEHFDYRLSYEGFKRHLNNLDRCPWDWRKVLAK